MKVDANTTFSQIHAEMGSKWNNLDKEIRGKPNELYVHSTMKKSGSGIEAQKKREAKFKDGATMVKNSIDKQFGRGMGDLVFKKVTSSTFDPNKAIKRSDLDTIKTGIELVLQDKLTEVELNLNPHTFKKLSTQEKLENLENARSVMNNKAAPEKLQLRAKAAFDKIENHFKEITEEGRSLVNIAKSTLPPKQRDEAITELKKLISGMDGLAFEKFLKPAGGEHHKDIVDALFDLRLSNGQRAFSVNDLAERAKTQFQALAPMESSDFFRDISGATLLLSRAMWTLDGGRIATLAQDFKGYCDEGAKRKDVPQTVKVNGGEAINPTVVGDVLTRALTRFGTVQAGPELSVFLTGVKDGIDGASSRPTNNATNQPWTGSDYVRNAAVLRGLTPLMSKDAESPAAAKLGKAVGACFQIIFTGHDFKSDTSNSVYNALLPTLKNPGNFQTFLNTKLI